MASPRPSRWPRVLARAGLVAALGVLTLHTPLAHAATAPEPVPTIGAPASRVIEIAGSVDFRPRGLATWVPATNGLAVQPGDRIRTGAGSRAAVQFSDRSIFRLNELTTLEVQPPRHAEKRRFQLLEGVLFFFNRERPADVEFETPLVTGAIRGTEFALEAVPGTGATRLALLDGRVELTGTAGSLNLEAGELARIDPGQPPAKSPLLEASRVVQWALYYPAVVAPEDLPFAADDLQKLAPSLAAYRSGDLLAARAALEAIPPGDEAQELYRAALELAVGRVDRAEALLASRSADAPAARALTELIAVVRDQVSTNLFSTVPRSASEWLARSYTEQSHFHLRPALAAAHEAVRLAPGLGFAHLRVAELSQMLELRRPARTALDQCLQLAPRLAPAVALRGFLALENNDPNAALTAFDQAIALDAALGNAWLGRGLALLRLRRREEGLGALQTAAALDPRRALHRSYLGRAFGQRGESTLADKEFRLAKELDPGDPTAWLYSALQRWQENRPNAAVRDLEESVRRNDNRGLFRSRLRLDRDLATRSADLAALYREAGLPEASLRSAALAVSQDYADASTHLYLADSYRALEDPRRFDLRYETVRENELLLANLLAPPEAATLSQLAVRQEHLRHAEPRPFAASSYTEYRSSGSWHQEASAYGAAGGLGYALDAALDWDHEPGPNADRERRDLSLQLKQRVAADDELYFQAGLMDARAGDVARHVDPADAKRDLHVEERQLPNLAVGWHHSWSPASHTLVLLSRLTDRLELRDADPSVLFLRQMDGQIISVLTPPLFDLSSVSDLELYSAEVQHLWQTDNRTLVIGARGQFGSVETYARLDRSLTGPVTEQRLDESLGRFAAYAYHDWHLASWLHFVAGVSYDRLSHPVNTEIAPLTPGRATTDQVAPKAGLLITPWHDGLLRASYSRSLGGVFFDQSIRLEPTQLAGFNQAFRSLLPESVAGQVPGTAFDAFQVGLDQSWNRGTYAGIGGEWLQSDGERTVGAFTNSLPLPIPDAASHTRQELQYREATFSAYLVQLIGDGLSLGVRYRLSEARLEDRYPGIPRTAAGHDVLESEHRSLLQHVGLTMNYQHPSGLFAQWASDWYHQGNSGYVPALPTEDFWQHDATVGYRFLQRRAEVRAGILNLFDTDYRLNPLNTWSSLPRGRTAVVSLRLSF